LAALKIFGHLKENSESKNGTRLIPQGAQGYAVYLTRI